MADEKADLKDIIDATNTLAKTLGVEEVVKPASQEIGKAGGTVAGILNLLLSPLEIMNSWGTAKREAFIRRMVERINAVPEERRLPAKKRLAIGAISGATIAEEDEEFLLRDMFMKLLTSSIDKDKVDNAHPSFLEIIRQLTPDEAKILEVLSRLEHAPTIKINAVRTGFEFQTGLPPGFITTFRNFSTLGEEAKCDRPDLAPTYLDNLRRLGLIDYSEAALIPATAYHTLLSHPIAIEEFRKIEESGATPQYAPEHVFITTLGHRFHQACMAE